MRKKFALSLSAAVCLALCFSAPFLTPAGSPPDFDVLIRNGRVYDGSLTAPLRLDVAVKDGRIVRVAPSIRGTAARTINAGGLIVAPGFIDMHTHVDDGMYFPENRACLNELSQGVTTVVVGQCGSSAWPIFDKASDLITLWSEEGIGPNAALLVGHGSVRQLVMGMDDREPSPEELEKMKALVREAMEQGASGMSTGLIYRPSSLGKTDEIVELAKVIAPYGGIYHSHIRNENVRILEAYREAVSIGERAGVPVHISHMKAIGRKNWGKAREACAIVEEARGRGLKVTGDQYPYRFANTSPYYPLIPRSLWIGRLAEEAVREEDIVKIFDYLRDGELIDFYKRITAYTPLSPNHAKYLNGLTRKRLLDWVVGNTVDLSPYRGLENPRERALFLEKLADPTEGVRIREAIKKYFEEGNGADNTIIGICVEKNLEGKTLSQVAALKGKSVEDTAIELDLMDAKCIPLAMGDEDIEFIMKKDYVTTGSDGTAPSYGIGLPHIRSYSTFLHKIKAYALEKKTITLAQAIRSQTSLSAEIMGWTDRGRIREGCWADIAVLDLQGLQTPTSISNPHQLSSGVKFLLVNGKIALDGGKYTGILAGAVIKGKGSTF